MLHSVPLEDSWVHVDSEDVSICQVVAFSVSGVHVKLASAEDSHDDIGTADGSQLDDAAVSGVHTNTPSVSGTHSEVGTVSGVQFSESSSVGVHTDTNSVSGAQSVSIGLA